MSNEYSTSEVSKHKTKDDLWIIIHGKVYDVSQYLEDHPGGAASLLEVAGVDATSTFEDVGHSNDARETMAQFLIGKLEGANEDDSGEPKPKELPLLVRMAMQQTSQGPQKLSHRMGSMLVKLILGSGVAYLSYTAVASLPHTRWRYHVAGGFWHGFLLASSAVLVSGTATVLWLFRNMPTKHTISSWPAHYKPTVVASPITSVTGFLKPQEYQKLPLVRKDQLSSNSYRLVFRLPKTDAILGLPIGQHISIRGDVDGKSVSRSYTPVSNNSDPGELRLIIKMYNDGQLTGGYLSKLNVGDQVEFRGPKGAMKYRRGLADEIGMVAGGTGITPMYQLIRAICENSRDKTKVHLLYGSDSEKDILLRNELDTFAEKYPENFGVTYVLSRPDGVWKGAKGYINKDLIEKKLPGPQGKSKILICGPPPLVESADTALAELGFEKPGPVSRATDQVFHF
ncbi:cytochrome b5 reductase-like protein [Myriangium duriaei CBS 260.36]|uniref:Cytochrome b5 reductase-like protein n=1 Tax=Myriangium duriaei CBS 260.36 TaxID=1168546 RepID=A0A9P4MI27_9PEZI|nr:cytochrome b5 reductase-like protein [Myriangium duriaei CBS 260.36]